METPLKSKAYALLGEISVNFSNLEFAMKEILAKLVDGEPDSIAGSLLVDRFILDKTLSTIHCLASFRYCHRPATIEALENLVKSVHEVRKLRNAFIHGLWLIEPDLHGGKVCVIDPNWKHYTKSKKKNWNRLEQNWIGLEKLEELKCQTGKLTLCANSLLKDLKPEEMAPRWQRANGKMNPPLAAGEGQVAANISSPASDARDTTPPD
jgi:hypothetical protein